MEILLVEDSPGDVRLTVEALKEGNVGNHLNVVHNGEEAISFLRCQGKFTNSKRPNLVLLDLNLPKKDGREVLAEIKEDPLLKSIPVIVLTISRDEQDILNTYRLCANCYIVKPVKYGEFITVIKSLENFWFTIAELPRR
ncbi:MAG: response regulator [Candidatus Bathyarchaeia archaeon]